ncbi:2Fe-2S iron-sulfur cluster-binding protein [Paraburkholderia flava]|uniref:2Fe-2S iron-sulfur cluster-binding protein n=1 Tax=Paraburkholderia flava TaxID=2547393 RepID=UPI001F0FCD47|nr:2Fe-2S iron-sulfur cluster-binding protein [Paraburkholderia flava]
MCSSSGFPATTEVAAEGGFEVRLERSGKQLVVSQGSTILQTLRDAGLAAASSCERGVCGVCESRVLSGSPTIAITCSLLPNGRGATR